jgi:hypothetical protein
VLGEDGKPLYQGMVGNYKDKTEGLDKREGLEQERRVKDKMEMLRIRRKG